MTTEIILAPSANLQPAPFFTPTPKAAKRVLEFFTGQINNNHTRRAYMNATRRFAAWCASKSIDELAAVQPFHVAAFIKDLQAEVSPPTVKQHLAAIRMLFDWLVTGHVIDVNPAHAVRGPKYVVKKGKTPVLTAEEARTLLDSIPGRTLSITYLGAGSIDKEILRILRKIEYWHMGSVKSFRILYQDADGLGGEVKWDGENAEVIAPR